MIKGEYKGASLGTLIALLVVAVVLIAAIGLGGGDDDCVATADDTEACD